MVFCSYYNAVFSNYKEVFTEKDKVFQDRNTLESLSQVCILLIQRWMFSFNGTTGRQCFIQIYSICWLPFLTLSFCECFTF